MPSTAKHDRCARPVARGCICPGFADENRLERGELSGLGVRYSESIRLLGSLGALASSSRPDGGTDPIDHSTRR
jgi:hypothetical protein